MMRNKIGIFLTALLITALLSNTKVLGTEAADFVVACGNKCDLTPKNIPLFNNTNIYPGWDSSVSLKAENNRNESLKFTIQAVFSEVVSDQVEQVLSISSDDIDLADVLSVKIEEDGSSAWKGWSGKLNDLKSPIVLSEIPSGGSRDYKITISMDTEAGNEYQGKTTVFDLNLIFDAISVTEKEGGGDESDGGNEDEEKDREESKEEVAGTSTFAVFYAGTGAITEGDTAGESIELAELSPEGLVLPAPDVAGETTCSDTIRWVWVLLLQLVIHALFYFAFMDKTSRNRILFTGSQILIGSAFVFIFWKYYCPIWDIIPSALLGLIASYVTYKKGDYSGLGTA